MEIRAPPVTPNRARTASSSRNAGSFEGNSPARLVSVAARGGALSASVEVACVRVAGAPCVRMAGVRSAGVPCVRARSPGAMGVPTSASPHVPSSRIHPSSKGSTVARTNRSIAAHTTRPPALASGGTSVPPPANEMRIGARADPRPKLFAECSARRFTFGPNQKSLANGAFFPVPKTRPRR